MALTGSQKAYLQARAGIARSGASRSNYVFPLEASIIVFGSDMTGYIRYGSLRVNLAINEEPDTASFDVMLTDSPSEASIVVGAEVLIGLPGEPLFGGRILTQQTTLGPKGTPRVRSVMCADYLQVLDSEYLVTYDWPAQSATTTILDLVARFTNKNPGFSLVISPASVQAGLPSHQAIGATNERFSTVLRRIVTMFPTGGGFYVDALKVLHVWAGASEPGVQNPAALTMANPTLKAFSETIDGSQIRDAVIVEGLRTTAPIGTPGGLDASASGRDLQSMPVLDASILDKVTIIQGGGREVRIGTQRVMFTVAQGPWSSPAGTPQSTVAPLEVLFDPGAAGLAKIWIESAAMFTGRVDGPWWVRIDEQYLKVAQFQSLPTPNASFIEVPRTGYGAMTGTVRAGAVVSIIDALSGGYVTYRYDAPGSLEQLRAQPIDSDVVMTVRSAAGVAIHEQIVQDGRYNRAGAAARGAREATDFKDELGSIQFASDDLNVKPGRLATYSLTDAAGTMSGAYMILTTELTWPVWGLPPMRHCTAAVVHPANVVDAWLVDRR